MSAKSARKPLFDRLKASLEEGIRFARGEISLQTTILPEPPPALKPNDVIQLRLQCNMSEQSFARTLNVSTRTVQRWEKGLRQPSQAALRLLQLLRVRPDVVSEVVGLGARAQERQGEQPRS